MGRMEFDERQKRKEKKERETRKNESKKETSTERKNELKNRKINREIQVHQFAFLFFPMVSCNQFLNQAEKPCFHFTGSFRIPE